MRRKNALALQAVANHYGSYNSTPPGFFIPSDTELIRVVRPPRIVPEVRSPLASNSGRRYFAMLLGGRRCNHWCNGSTGSTKSQCFPWSLWRPRPDCRSGGCGFEPRRPRLIKNPGRSVWGFFIWPGFFIGSCRPGRRDRLAASFVNTANTATWIE